VGSAHPMRQGAKDDGPGSRVRGISVSACGFQSYLTLFGGWGGESGFGGFGWGAFWG
jgi:hypothetical protein